MLQQITAQVRQPFGGYFRTKETLMEVNVESEWKDDHLPCARVTVAKDDIDISMVTFEIWWTSTELLAALRYADESPRAFEMVKELIDDAFNFDNLDKEGENHFCGPYGSLSLVSD